MMTAGDRAHIVRSEYSTRAPHRSGATAARPAAGRGRRSLDWLDTRLRDPAPQQPATDRDRRQRDRGRRQGPPGVPALDERLDEQDRDEDRAEQEEDGHFSRVLP